MVLTLGNNSTESTTVGRFGLEKKDPTIGIALPEGLSNKVDNYLDSVESVETSTTEPITKPSSVTQTEKLFSKKPKLRPPSSIKPKIRPGSVSPIDKILELNYLLEGRRDLKSKKSQVLSGLNSLSETGKKAIKGFMDNAAGGETNLDPVKDAWCAAFVAHVLTELGADPLKSKDRYDRLRADKYKEYGSKIENFADAKEGDIVVFDFDGDGKGDHVTFYAGDRITSQGGKDPYIGKEYINVVGGNHDMGEVSLREDHPNYTKDKVLAIRRITYNDIDFNFTQQMAEQDPVFSKFVPEYASLDDDVQSFDEGGLAQDDQMGILGFNAQSVQKEVDKYVDKDAEPAKDITCKDAAKFVAELTPIIGDAMAAKEVYDELQKDDPNYFLAGALGGAAIIGLIPGIGDAAAAAIRAGARKTLDVGKRIEIDPNTLGMFGGNLRAKGYDEPSEETLELMRKEFPAMEARDEVYRIGEKKDPKSFSGAIDVKVGPEKELVEVPTYPSEPERFSVRYNPDRAKVVLKKDIVTLNTGEVVDMSRNRIVPTKGSLKIEDLVEPDDNVLYRGMSAEEYRGALDQGYIKSKGDYNIGTDQQGLTFYSTNPSQAENYANNFTPGGFRATPDRPAYVVAIKKPEKIDYVTGQTEFGIKKEVPTSDIVEVFEGQPYMYQGDVRIVDDFGGPKVSGSSPDVAQVTWEKIGKPSDSKKLDKEMISVFPKPERMFPEESRPKGGDYLNPATGEVLSGRNVSSAKLSISPEGRPSFKVSNDNVEEVGSVGKGKTQIKTNLFKKKAGWKWTKAPEGMKDIATLISVENKGKHFYTIETDFSKGVNLKKYPNSKTEPRLRPTVVGEIEIGPQIGTISVRGKEHPVYQNIRTFNQGGTAMKDQMEMAFMQQGGIKDDGMTKDPVSGNPIPPGSMANEVRDDIPAMLSEGEYVVPADVLRFYGVNFFEDLRSKAKSGLQNMEKNGRIGGEPLSPQQVQQNMGNAPQANSAARMPVAANTGPFMGQPVTNEFQPSAFSTVGGTLYNTPQQAVSVTSFKTFVNPEINDTRIIEYINGKVKNKDDEKYTQPPYYEYGSAALKQAQENIPTSTDGGGGVNIKPEPKEPDPNAWAKDITDPEAWARENLETEGKSAIELGLSVSKTRALAITAEAQGKDDLAERLRKLAREVVEKETLLQLVPEGALNGTSRASALQKDKDLVNSIFSIKTIKEQETVPSKSNTGFVSIDRKTGRPVFDVSKASSGSDKPSSLEKTIAAAKEASENVTTEVEKDESGNVTGVSTTGGTAEEQQTMQDYVTSAAAGNKGGLMQRKKKKGK